MLVSSRHRRMADESTTLWERVKTWLSTVADVLTIATVFGSTSAAALISYRLDSQRLTRLFVILAAASAAALLLRILSFVVRWARYRFFSTTTVELHGGNSLTLVIQHKGLPVKVRARATFMEFGEDMESHPAPYDLQLFTRVHGGRFELIELNKTFDMAKSIFGQLQKLADDAAQFSVERPGLSAFVAVAQDGSAVLAYLNITVIVITPVGATNITKLYRLYVSHEAIRVTDDTDAPKAMKRSRKEATEP